MLKIFNPANGRVIAELPQDSPESVAAKYRAARQEQPAWAATPLATRLAAIHWFRGEIVRESERLAAILTSEVGKPIRQSRNELTGLLGRIDLFLSAPDRTLAPQQVFDEGGMREVISHEPLGVIANISAWNYPYFVGANVFVPAQLAGNAVLYKPSEFATLTGLARRADRHPRPILSRRQSPRHGAIRRRADIGASRCGGAGCAPCPAALSLSLPVRQHG